MNSRVLFLDQFAEIGGAQRCLLNLLPAFRDAGYETHLAIPGEGPYADAARDCRTLVHAMPCGQYAHGQKSWTDIARFAYDLPRQASRIASLMSEYRVDLIYVNGPRMLPAAALASSGRPAIFHSHSIVAQNSVARFVRRSIQSAKACLIGACRFVLKPLKDTVDCSHVVYNGIPPMLCERRSRAEHEPWRIGVIGRIAPEKGQLAFVQAARVVSGQLRCEFVVCGDSLFSGDDYGQKVRHEAQDLPIHFVGWQNDVRAVLATLDLVVVPSSAVDATPLVILEAFSAGVPVIAFRSGGIPEIVDDGVTGVLCPPTAQDLACRLIQLLSGPRAVLDSLAPRAKSVFASRFSLARYQTEVLDVVRDTMSRSNVL
jgi:glycosyltransferase involved in cell wall biosynthesis